MAAPADSLTTMSMHTFHLTTSTGSGVTPRWRLLPQLLQSIPRSESVLWPLHLHVMGSPSLHSVRGKGGETEWPGRQDRFLNPFCPPINLHSPCHVLALDFSLRQLSTVVTTDHLLQASTSAADGGPILSCSFSLMSYNILAADLVRLDQCPTIFHRQCCFNALDMRAPCGPVLSPLASQSKCLSV